MEQDQETEQDVKPPRGARKRARTRADLLTAARHVFATRGYHDAAILDITQAADVGVGTFYLHFRDKDAIFNTLLEEGMATIREQVMEAIQQEAHPSLPMIIQVIFQGAYEQRDLFRIALMGDVVSRRFSGREMLVQMFTGFLEHTSSLAPFSEDDISLLARLMSGVMLQAISWWFEQDEPGPDIMAERVLYVMRNGFPASLFEVQ